MSVKIKPMKVTVEKGENLWQALKKHHIAIDLPCAGNGTCGRCAVEVEQFGRVKSCQFRLPGSYEVTVPKQPDFHAVGEEMLTRPEAVWEPDFLGKDDWDRQPAAAVDIGTTTVAMMVCYQGKKLFRSFTNPQRALGADVMSRIRLAADGQADTLQRLIQERLDQELEDAFREILGECGETDLGLCKAAIGANTTMLHLLCGWSCEGLGRAPFTPVCVEKSNRERTLKSGRRISETLLPGLSAFIGADVVSGIYAIGMMEKQEPVLLLDLGTNGEMALGCSQKLLTASAAAGPAFEGSDLAVSLHASGVLHCLRKLKEIGMLDETGLLAEPFFETGYPASGVCGGQIPENLYITQEDIRQIQMAKAAIRAGIDLLLMEYNISEKDVAQVYLAGGMGYYLDASDAAAIGLIPKEWEKKTCAAGNTSLLGCLRYLQEGAVRADKALENIRSHAREVVLAEHPAFEEHYIGHMNL